MVMWGRSVHLRELNITFSWGLSLIIFLGRSVSYKNDHVRCFFHSIFGVITCNLALLVFLGSFLCILHTGGCFGGLRKFQIFFGVLEIPDVFFFFFFFFFFLCVWTVDAGPQPTYGEKWEYTHPPPLGLHDHWVCTIITMWGRQSARNAHYSWTTWYILHTNACQHYLITACIRPFLMVPAMIPSTPSLLIRV